MNQINHANQYLFEDLVKQIQMRSGAVGIAVAIVDTEGKTQYEKYFGCRDKEEKLPMDDNTIFGLASVTKSFVALSIMQLCERGILSLEDPVSKYIPEFTNKNQETVKIHHFLSHSAGFFPVPRTLIKNVAESLGITEEKDGDFAYIEALAKEGTKVVARQLDAQEKGKGLIGRPGDYMSYCNDGFGLLSEIVRREGGEPSFAEYVKKNILAPLGMERSGCDFLRPRLDPNAAVLYRRTENGMEGTRDYYDNAFALSGAGSMKSTIGDMKKLLAMYLNYGKGPDGTRLLSMEGIKAMVRPRIEYRPESYYCFGLSTKKLDDLTVVEHGGSLTGVSSNLSWSYDAGAGVIVLCNTSDVPVSAIADAAMRMYHGRNPLGDRDYYREEAWSAKTKKEACGFYGAAEEDENSIEIYEQDGRICVRAGSAEMPFITVSESVGVIRGYANDKTIKLFWNEEGHVFAIGFGGRMMPKKQ